MQAKNIDEVIAYLDQIIEKTKKDSSPLGYFAALYRKVTISVKEGIERKEFDDNERMEQLDVVFANRYLAAYTAYQAQKKPTESWAIVFEKSTKYWPIVLQHLLLGMNAHINLDLGVAAAETCPGAKIDGLKDDFDKINEVLAKLVGEVEQELTEIWPKLKYILNLTGKVDTFLINFSMETARDGAWKFAKKLAAADSEADFDKMIQERDGKVAVIAELVTPPGILLPTIFGLIRLGERGTIAQRIEILK